MYRPEDGGRVPKRLRVAERPGGWGANPGQRLGGQAHESAGGRRHTASLRQREPHKLGVQGLGGRQGYGPR